MVPRDIDAKFQRIDWKLHIVGIGLYVLGAWSIYHGHWENGAFCLASGSGYIAQARWNRIVSAKVKLRQRPRPPNPNGDSVQ